MRRLAVASVIAVALVAAVGSSPVAEGGDISGSVGPRTVELTADQPEHSERWEALVSTEGVLEDGGEVSLTVSFPSDAVGQVLCSITSDVTGETNEIEVFDPTVQPELSIAIEAFAGCGDASECGETFEVRFARLESPVTNDLILDWTLEGLAGVVEDADGEVPSGTLAFTPAE